MLPSMVGRQVKFAGAAWNGRAASNAVEKLTVTQRAAYFANHVVEGVKALIELLNDQVKRLLGNGGVATVAIELVLVPLDIFENF